MSILVPHLRSSLGCPMSFRGQGLLIGLCALTWMLIVACQPTNPNVSENCRPVEHLMGQTCIPQLPQRVVALHDSTLLDPLLALGLEPIAVAAYPTESGEPLLRGIPPDAAPDLTLVGTPDQPNLESILAIQPDLIIGREFQQGFYDQLSAIAPTILIHWEDGGFKNHLQTLATLLEQPQAAQTVLDHYQERIQNFQQAMGERLVNWTVSIIAVQGSAIKSFGHQSTLGQVLQDAEVQRPASQEQPEGRIDFSLEQLTAHDGDVIFLIHEAGDDLASYQQNPLWQQLQAVKSDRMYVVEPEDWIVAGPLGANRVLDDLFKYLIEEN